MKNFTYPSDSNLYNSLPFVLQLNSDESFDKRIIYLNTCLLSSYSGYLGPSHKLATIIICCYSYSLDSLTILSCSCLEKFLSSDEAVFLLALSLYLPVASSLLNRPFSQVSRVQVLLDGAHKRACMLACWSSKSIVEFRDVSKTLNETRQDENLTLLP